MYLLIDNYDSFTYNLYHYFLELGAKVEVYRNDKITTKDILKKQIFSYNAMAEATLANIAEAQDRYKSEQGTYINDLRKLYSHIGGAGGMNECVKILSVKAGFDYWRAEAAHLSSPETVIWDSRAGTSLKKG